MRFPLFERFQTWRAGPGSAPALPDGTPTPIRQSWERQQSEVPALLEKVRGHDAVRHARAGKARPTGLPPFGGAFARFASPDASRVFAGVLVQDVPSDTMATGLTCLREDVRRVVDLRSNNERQTIASCFEGRAHARDGDFAEFEVRRLGMRGESDDPLEQPALDLAALAPGARREDLQLRLRVDNRMPAVDAGGELTLPEPGSEHPQAFRLRRWDVPLERDAAIRPDLLRALMNELAESGLRGKVAFISPRGDRRAALCAAATRLHERFHRGELERHDLEDAVMDVCVRLRTTREPDLLDDPADIASLLAFCDLMLLLDRPASRAPTAPRSEPRVRVDPHVVVVSYDPDQVGRAQAWNADVTKTDLVGDRPTLMPRPRPSRARVQAEAPEADSPGSDIASSR